MIIGGGGYLCENGGIDDDGNRGGGIGCGVLETGLCIHDFVSAGC